MPSQDTPRLSIGEKNSQDRATAAILAGGGAGGMPAFALRHWTPGVPGGSPETPVFINWLTGVGRFCLMVRYGRYFLRDSEWYIETRAGLRSTQPPLEQVWLEALKVSETLRRRMGRSVPVSPTLALFDTQRDRDMERLASQSRVPLLWDLERYTAKLAGARTGPHFRQPLERSQVLAEMSALLERSEPVGVGASRAQGQRHRSASGH